MSDWTDDHAHTRAARRDLDDAVVAAIRIGRVDHWKLSPVATTVAGATAGGAYLLVSWLAESAIFGIGLLVAAAPFLSARVRRFFLSDDASATERSQTDEPLALIIRADRVDIHRMRRLATRMGEFVESHPLHAVHIQFDKSSVDTRVAINGETHPVVGRSVPNLRTLARHTGLAALGRQSGSSAIDPADGDEQE
jgi:hypothetical protein